jgi:hypothetical protein
MNKLFSLSVAILVLAFWAPACKTKPPAPVKVSVTDSKPKVIGRVTHAYQSAGCGTAVIMTDSVSGSTTILLPDNNLAAFDVDGLQIRFHYRPLKKRNPTGCKTGAPALLLDIEKR